LIIAHLLHVAIPGYLQLSSICYSKHKRSVSSCYSYSWKNWHEYECDQWHPSIQLSLQYHYWTGKCCRKD